jgi:hypothetical protein
VGKSDGVQDGIKDFVGNTLGAILGGKVNVGPGVSTEILDAFAASDTLKPISCRTSITLSRFSLRYIWNREDVTFVFSEIKVIKKSTSLN